MSSRAKSSNACHVCIAQALDQGHLGPSLILGIVAPLLQQALVGARLQEGTPHKRSRQADSDKQRGRDAALVESAVAALQSAAAALGWTSYRQLLGRCLVIPAIFVQTDSKVHIVRFCIAVWL